MFYIHVQLYFERNMCMKNENEKRKIIYCMYEIYGEAIRSVCRTLCDCHQIDLMVYCMYHYQTVPFETPFMYSSLKMLY